MRFRNGQRRYFRLVFSNESLAPSKLALHLKNKHPEHQNKSKEFFEAELKAFWSQQSSFESVVLVANKEKPLVRASLEMALVMMQAKRPYTELETVVLPCLKIAAKIIHGGDEAVKKVDKLALSDTTTRRRCKMVADDLKDQLFKKLHQAVCYGLQLDETTDVAGEVQLIVYCHIPDLGKGTLVDHYVCCVPVGVETTAQAIFDKLTEFLDEGDVQLDKCKAMTTDGAAAMTGRVNGLVKKNQAVSPTCVATHCMIHREALAAKPIGSDKTEKNELELVLEDVVKIVNAVKANTKKHRMFSKLCKDMDAEFSKLLYHSGVRWLSRGKVLNRVLALREELTVFFTEQADEKAVLFQDDFWVSRLAYLADVFGHLNKLNLGLQGNGGDVFITISKVHGFEKKIEQWKRRAENADFSDFPELQTFMRGSNWWVMENEEESLQQVVTRLVVDHLTLLQSNFNKYFPEEEKQRIAKKQWIINPFVADEDERLCKLQTDLVQKVNFRTFETYSDFWISLLRIPEYQQIAEEAVSALVAMPSSYLCKKKFSALAGIKTKQRASIEDVDTLMRGALSELEPRFDKIADSIQQQPSH